MTVDELMAKLDAEYDKWSAPKFKGFKFIWMGEIRALQDGIRRYVNRFGEESRKTPTDKLKEDLDAESLRLELELPRHYEVYGRTKYHHAEANNKVFELDIRDNLNRQRDIRIIKEELKKVIE